MTKIEAKLLEKITGGWGALLRAGRGEPMFPNWAANRLGRFQARRGGGGCPGGNCGAAGGGAAAGG